MEIEYWVNTPDGYDNRYLTVDTDDVETAFREVKKYNWRAKDLKIYKK